MTPRLLLQLAWLFHVEADSQLPDPYIYPRKIPTLHAQREANRLRDVASDIFERAEALLPPDAPTGTDAAFGEP